MYDPQPGQLCWFDLTTPDIDASQEFYSSLLGWEFSGTGPMGLGRAAVSGGRRVAGLSPQPPQGPESPAFWTVYFRIDSLEDVLDAVDAGGGRPLMALPEFDGQSSVSLILDSAETAFGVLAYPDERGVGAFGEPGAVAWAELHTKDPEIGAFYERIFGWELTALSDTEEQRYSAISAGGRRIGGALDASALEVPAHWEAHIAVDDVDAMAARVVELGGGVLVPPHDSHHGRVGRFVDPQFAAFTLVTPAD